MPNFANRQFYANGRIKFEYLRTDDGIRHLRCWTENGEPIPPKNIQYNTGDTDKELAIKLKYVCRQMPVPRFFPDQLQPLEEPLYEGVDF
jgi:hypothetical protein